MGLHGVQLGRLRVDLVRVMMFFMSLTMALVKCVKQICLSNLQEA